MEGDQSAKSTLTELSIKDRYSIIALDQYTGWNHERIATAINCDRRTVDRILQKWREHNTVEDMETIWFTTTNHGNCSTSISSYDMGWSLVGRSN